MGKGIKSFFNGNQNHLPITASPCTQQPPSLTSSRASSINVRARLEEELSQVFKKFDVNGDGKVSASELGSIMGSLGSPATVEELAEMIKEVDSDGDGCINFQEFIELNTKDIDSNEALANLQDAFAVFDMDKNGSISAEELQNVFRVLGEECSLADCKKMISGVDSNGDGMISFEEFKVMMMMGSRFDTKS